MKTNGFNAEEIEDGPINVFDKNSREWNDPAKDTTGHLILTGIVTLRSRNVDAVRATAARIGDLIRSSVIISGEPIYHFTKFLDLKQSMLPEATRNALQAATDLIAPTKAKLKGIRQAQQGMFTIRAKDAYSDENSINEQASIEKRIRVVMTVTFNLEN